MCYDGPISYIKCYEELELQWRLFYFILVFTIVKCPWLMNAELNAIQYYIVMKYLNDDNHIIPPSSIQ